MEWQFRLGEDDAPVEVKDDTLKNVQEDLNKVEILFEKSEGNKVEGFNRNNTGYKFWRSDGRIIDHGDVENFINQKRVLGDKHFIADFPVVKEGESAPSYTIVGRKQPYFAYDKRLKDPYEDGDNLKSTLLGGSYYLEQTYDGHISIGYSSKGESADKIKQALNQIYANDATFIKLIADGNYDNTAATAVNKFQKDNFLKETDGITGKETIRAIDSKLVSSEFADLSYESIQNFIDVSVKNKEEDGESGDDFSEEDVSYGIGSFKGMGAPSLYSSKGVGGTTNLSTENALSVLDNVSKGQSPFKPELGKGGASWFTVEGDPYVGNLANKPIQINVQIANYTNPLVFREANLLTIYDNKLITTASEAEKVWRLKENKIGTNLTPPQAIQLANFKNRFAESKMWDEVGLKARTHVSKVAEVYIEKGSRFSTRGSGKFVAIADPQLIEIKGGIEPIVNSLTAQGLGTDPVLLEASEALRTKMKWAGNVRAAFRYGGRILLILGIAADIYKIYRAEDKLKAVVESVGGWSGATAGASAFAAWWTPADVAGPWAWVVHGVGTLVSGAIGYWIGSSTTRYIYEMVAEEDSDHTSTGTPMEGGGSSNIDFGSGDFGGGGGGSKW